MSSLLLLFLLLLFLLLLRMLNGAGYMLGQFPGLSLLVVAMHCAFCMPGIACADTPGEQHSFSLPELPSNRLQFVVRDFQFSGNTVIDNQALQDVAREFLDKPLTISALEELRTRITRLYVARGYLNSGAVLQVAGGPEPFPNGVVPIRLIEGRISEVRIRGQGRLAQGYLRDRLVSEPEVFNMPVLQQRFQLLLSDPLFEKINSRIIPGDQPGSAILDIDVQRAKAYGLNVFLSNYRAPSIGSDVLGMSGWVRNLTGYGDLLEANVAHSEGADPVHLGWSMPINSRGTALKLSIDQGNSSVIGASLAAVDIKSRSSGYEFGVTQTLLSSLSRKMELGVSYSQRDSQTSLLGEAFSFTPGEPDGYSKTRVWHLTQEWTERRDTDAMAIRSVFAFGSNNTDHSDTTLQVPDQHYRIWIGQLQYVKNLERGGAQIVVRGSAQYTPDRLLPLERFSLGGVATVRGYRENALVRDRAYMLNAELHYPLSLGQESGHKLKLIALADVARANNTGETAQNLGSLGAGLNWQWKNWTADLIWAKSLTTLPGQEGGNLQDHGIHLQLSYRVF